MGGYAHVRRVFFCYVLLVGRVVGCEWLIDSYFCAEFLVRVGAACRPRCDFVFTWWFENLFPCCAFFFLLYSFLKEMAFSLRCLFILCVALGSCVALGRLLYFVLFAHVTGDVSTYLLRLLLPQIACYSTNLQLPGLCHGTIYMERDVGLPLPLLARLYYWCAFSTRNFCCYFQSYRASHSMLAFFVLIFSPTFVSSMAVMNLKEAICPEGQKCFGVQ